MQGKKTLYNLPNPDDAHDVVAPGGWALGWVLKRRAGGGFVSGLFQGWFRIGLGG